MLIIPIAALIFIGGSYLLATRFLPASKVMKAVPWMAAAALLSYFLTQFVAGIFIFLLGIPAATVPFPLWVMLSLLGAAAGAALVLNRFVRRHRRGKAERDAQAATF